MSQLGVSPQIWGLDNNWEVVGSQRVRSEDVGLREIARKGMKCVFKGHFSCKKRVRRGI
jgi:hypothetical protein